MMHERAATVDTEEVASSKNKALRAAMEQSGRSSVLDAFVNSGGAATSTDATASCAVRPANGERGVEGVAWERASRLRCALLSLGKSVEEVDEIERGVAPSLAGVSGLSSLELLPMEVLGVVARHLPAPDLLGSFAVTSQALREATRRGRASHGWDALIRRSLKALYERGEAKVCGLNFLAVDKEGGKADIVEAAVWGYRTALAACKIMGNGWGEWERDTKAGVALLQAEYASEPSEESGGRCSWCIVSLAWLYYSGDCPEIEQCSERALELMREAADDHRNFAAACIIADWYRTGELWFEEDEETRDEKGLDYFRKAALEGGSAKAAFHLGAHYCKQYVKQGIIANLAEGVRLLQNAKERGISEARPALVRTILRIVDLPDDDAAAELGRARALALLEGLEEETSNRREEVEQWARASEARRRSEREEEERRRQNWEEERRRERWDEDRRRERWDEARRREEEERRGEYQVF